MNTQAHLSDIIKSSSGRFMLALIVVAVLFVGTVYGNHLLRLLPYGLFFLCPLIHLLHRGHGNTHGE
jgi:hypothetical protein